MLRSKQKGLEIDNYIALFIQPDLSEPDLSEPDLSEPDLSEPDLSEPDSSGFLEGPIGQPFTAGSQASNHLLARFNGLFSRL